MKKVWILLLAAVFLHGCTSGNAGSPSAQPPANASAQTPAPALEQPPSSEQPANPPAAPGKEQGSEQPSSSFANEIFQNVTVKKTGPDTFEVKGQAQVFEGVVSYVVEDGHNELTEGSIQASAGAPAWGDFTHAFSVKKAEPNSTLMLILFETSAKDGSRRMELIIPLPEG